MKPNPGEDELNEECKSSQDGKSFISAKVGEQKKKTTGYDM